LIGWPELGLGQSWLVVHFGPFPLARHSKGVWVLGFNLAISITYNRCCLADNICYTIDNMDSESTNYLKLGYVWGLLSSGAVFKKRGNSPYIQVSNTDKRALEILSEYGGNIYGPFGRSYRWRIAGSDLERFIESLDYWIPSSIKGLEYKRWRKENFD